MFGLTLFTIGPILRFPTMAHKSKLLIEQRRRRMLDLVGQDGQATVAELAKIFSISAVTARG